MLTSIESAEPAHPVPSGVGRLGIGIKQTKTQLGQEIQSHFRRGHFHEIEAAY